MRKTKFIITLLMAVLMTFSSAFCVSVSAASSPDEAVISGNYDGIEPIPTEKPEDKPVKHGKGFSNGDYALFYTQTTFLSSLLTQIPVIRNSIVFFILLLAQLLFVFIFHHNIKKMKIYGTVITALAVSNIINGIIAWCWAYQSINSISVPIKQGTDILGIVMAKASFGMFAYLISGIAIVVFAECIVSVFIKYRTKKKQQLIHNI